MKMKKIKSKFLAALLSVLMTMVFVGMIPANAISVSTVPGATMTYTVYTEKVSGYSNRVKITFKTVHNPGVSVLSVAVKGSSNCTAISASSDYGFGAEGISSDKTLALYNWASVKGTDYNKTLEFEYVFDINGNSNSSYAFDIAIVQYVSKADNKSEKINTEDFFKVKDASIVTTPSRQIIIGDTNDDGKIDIDDYTEVLRILDYASLDQLSTLVLDNALTKNLNKWRTTFPNLPCAEVADVNCDNLIKQDDAKEILSYYSKLMAGSEKFESYIGSKHALTIIV